MKSKNYDKWKPCEKRNHVKSLTVNNKLKKYAHQQTDKPQENNFKKLSKHCNEEHHVEL